MRLFLVLAVVIAIVSATPVPDSSLIDASNGGESEDNDGADSDGNDTIEAQAAVAKLRLTPPMTTTGQRISGHGYPVEKHMAETEDGYILTMFRIPYSPKLKNQNTKKPVIFLQHGLMSSSDCWILNGPNDALAYVMSDAGYDVWLGNFRGNVYSRKNINYKPTQSQFWNFSWNEIALQDLPAMINKVLMLTGEDALHYVGHSQGTTTFMVLLSSKPSFNYKFKTTHMLAPVGFMENMQSPLAKVAAPFLGKPALLAKLFGSNEFLPNNELIGLLGGKLCSETSPMQAMCGNVLFLMAGWDSKHLNYTLLPDAVETHPAGSSTSQVVHYLQEYESGHFRKYDYGRIENLLKYGHFAPPDYEVSKISPGTPVQFYYSDNDYFAAVQDVKRMAGLLGDNVQLYHVKYPEWNHMDYLWALEVKAEIYDRIVRLANDFENNVNKINKF